MFTLTQIRSWSPRELELKIFALDRDAGAFSVPEVQAIVKKLYGRRNPDEKDQDYGTETKS